MKKISIYSSGNYIVISDGKTTATFSQKFTIYNEKQGEFVLSDFFNNRYIITLESVEREVYINEQKIAYNVATMIEFLRLNTGK